MSKTITPDVLFELFENGPDGVLIIDKSGTVLHINQRIEEMFGWKRDELIGNLVEQLIPERFIRHVDFRISYFQSPKRRAMGENRRLFGLRKDGSEFPVDIMLNPIQEFVSATIRDVSEIEEKRRKFSSVLEQLQEVIAQLVPQFKLTSQ